MSIYWKSWQRWVFLLTLLYSTEANLGMGGNGRAHCLLSVVTAAECGGSGVQWQRQEILPFFYKLNGGRQNKRAAAFCVVWGLDLGQILDIPNPQASDEIGRRGSAKYCRVRSAASLPGGEQATFFWGVRLRLLIFDFDTEDGGRLRKKSALYPHCFK